LVALAQNQQGSSHIDAKGKERKRLKDGELPPELDFFKYATAGPSKRKPSESGGEGHARTKRHRKSDNGSDANAGDEADGDGIATNPSDNSGMPRQRVTIKGNNAPRRADTFKELHDRYHIHSQLMDNLKRYYEHPTGIQSAGCPILLEVSRLIV
jgi:ATP-dependent RNA helicase DDX52/ROK1